MTDCYEPNSAAINRFLAFTKAFEESGIHTVIVFIRPNQNYDKVHLKFKNVVIQYLWENKILIKDKLRYFQQIFWIISFLQRLKKGDNLILNGTTEFLFVFSYFHNKINLYHEITEHPDIGRNTKSLTLRFFHNLYLRRCKSLKGLFVISTELKKYFLCMGIPNNKIHIVNMIGDSSRFDGLERNTNVEKYIAYCGAIVNSKDGVDVLIKAFKIVQEKISDLKLLLIGGFPVREDEIINRNLVTELHLQEQVIFTGEISSDEMPQVLKNAQALVLARPDNLQAKNGFPTKLGEYLLTSNPVIVTNVGDIGLFLKNCESALIATPGDERDIAEKICFALQNKDEAQKIGKRGSEVAMQHFNYKTETKKISRVIFNDPSE